MQPSAGTEAEKTVGETCQPNFLPRRLLPLAAVLLAGLAVTVFGVGKFLDPGAMVRALMQAQDYVRHHDTVFLFGFTALYTIAVAFSLPLALPLTVSGGFLFGWVTGALIGITAKTLGSFLLFIVARHGFSGFVSRHAGPRLAAIEEHIRSDSFLYLLFLRLQPVVPFFLVNLAAALFGVRARLFILATALGVAPGAFISSFSGAGLGEIFERNQAYFDLCLVHDATACDQVFSLSELWSSKAFAALLLMAFLALVPKLARRLLPYSGDHGKLS